MRALCACFLLASILSSGFSWTVKSTHSNVVPQITSNVTLRCFYDGPTNGMDVFSRPLRIRLLKESSDLRSNVWKTYVQLVYPNQSKPVLNNPNQPGVSVSGHLGNSRESYLSVTWSSASNDTVGSYKCEINGLTAINEDIGKILTDVVSISHHATPVSGIRDITDQMRRLEERVNQLDVKYRLLENRIMTENQSTTDDNYFEGPYWPVGQYALLTDSYGCPNIGSSEFTAGYAIVQSKTVERPKHVFPSRFDDSQTWQSHGSNVLRFNFCRMDGKDLDWSWPNGSYCLSQATHCPRPFRYSYIRFDLESLVDISVSVIPQSPRYFNRQVRQHGEKAFQFEFCCRKDGDVNTPMLLPNFKPFYLYRFGGVCQKVQNMDVTNVTIQIDTDDTKGFSYSVDCPDHTMAKGVHSVELCYYTKKARCI